MRMHKATMEEAEKENGQTQGPESEPLKVTEPVEDNLATKLAEAEKQVEMYKDLLYRKAAEFENFKKRAENEAGSIVRFANEGLIGELLPVLDDFERSLKAAKSSNEFESLFKGIELIYQKLVKNLEKRGVKSFETVGKEFNVDFHDALLQVAREDVAPHTVLEEIEKGYMLNDRVIRHAKVIVSTTPADITPSSEAEQPAGGRQPQPGKN
jgi:molecular chaperone GrpE